MNGAASAHKEQPAVCVQSVQRSQVKQNKLCDINNMGCGIKCLAKTFSCTAHSQKKPLPASINRIFER